MLDLLHAILRRHASDEANSWLDEFIEEQRDAFGGLVLILARRLQQIIKISIPAVNRHTDLNLQPEQQD